MRASDQAKVRALFNGAASQKKASILTKVQTASGQYKLTIDVINDTPQAALFLCQLTPDIAIDSARLRFLLEHLDQGVWNYNTLSDVFEVTDAWRRMRGMRMDADLRFHNMDPETWLECIHPDDRETVKNLFLGQANGTKDRIGVQYRRWHPGGH